MSKQDAASEPQSKNDESLVYLQGTVQALLKPMMLDLLKERPANVLDFVANWCVARGATLHGSQSNFASPLTSSHALDAEQQMVAAVNAHLADSATFLPTQTYLPSSDEEDELFDEQDARWQKEQLEKRKSGARKKHAVSAEAYGSFNRLENFTPRFVPKTPEQAAHLAEILRKNFMFNALDEKEQAIVIGAMEVKSFAAGAAVITQGDDGQELFIVAEGRLACSKRFAGAAAETFLRNYEAGELFGELALMYNAPRAASIRSLTPSVLYSLDRDTFNNIVKTSAIQKRAAYEKFLDQIDILRDLEPYERVKLCDCLQTEKFGRGDVVIRQGDEGDRFYLIQEGTAEVLKKNEAGEVEHVYDYKANDYFGELAMLSGDKRKATVRVTSERMVVASLDKLSFKRLLGSVESILKRNASRYEKYVKKRVM